MNKLQLIKKYLGMIMIDYPENDKIYLDLDQLIEEVLQNTRTESKPIQVSEPVNTEGEYWDAKQVIENPKDYHKQTVYDAGNFIRGYELALSQQPEVSQEYFDKIHSILDDSEGWVSVDDRLPEINKPVLIFAKYGKQATARRTGELWIDLMRTQHSYGSITHWQHYLTHLKNKIMAQITTIYEYPPIPIRDYDWSAIRKDYEGGDLIGHGRTAQDAIEDLINQEENK